MHKRSPEEQAWMKQTIRQSILASLKRRVSSDDLYDEQWLQFRDLMQEGDEIWYYKTPIETWTEWFPLCGREGYVLVRDDKIIEEILLSIS
jgi:hypothetical protein